MNSIEFKKELEEYIKKEYEEFEEYQKLAFETLIEFCRVCEKNNIQYQLAYGSLLGAIRDKGQIPWDYDIDVFVPYYERKKLIESLKKDLNDKFYVASPEFNSKVHHNMPRITPKGWDSRYLHVDVFYLIGTPETKNKRVHFCKKIKKICEIKKAKLVNIEKEIENSKVKKIKKALLLMKKIAYSLVSNKWLDKKYDKMCSKYNAKESSILSTGDIFADWYEFPKDILKTQKIDIYNNSFYIPEDYNEILKIVYGNYNKIFPIEKRYSEFEEHYKLLSNNNKNFNKVK